jgi:peptide/nickel transport system permease protein
MAVEPRIGGGVTAPEVRGLGAAVAHGAMSPWRLAWRRFRRHRLAMASSVIIALLALSAVVAPWISPRDPYSPDLFAIRKGPSREHLLGTDGSGRDVFARLLYGGRVSLSVGLVAVSIYLTIGTILGALAGYRRGLADAVIMRITDTVMSFPTLLIILAIVPIVGPSIFNIMVIIGFLGWTGIARLVRGEFLSLRERDFVLAARCLGATDRRIIFRHILPNVVGPLVVAATFGIPGAIMSEAGLSFLGLGVQAPEASWGNILNAATDLDTLQTKPWLWVPAGGMIAITVLCINFIGDGLRDALDPRTVLERQRR